MQKRSTHFTVLYLGVFCKFFGDFWEYLGGDSFSQRIGKIRRNKKFLSFEAVLKLEFEERNY